jgi:type I restriction enzyme R subunit
MRRLIDAPDSDLFDVLAYIRFDMPPLTRTDRAEKVRHSDLDTLPPQMRDFIAAILNSYVTFGEAELAATKLAGYLAARFGTTADAKKVLGDIPVSRRTYLEVQKRLYEQ